MTQLMVGPTATEFDSAITFPSPQSPFHILISPLSRAPCPPHFTSFLGQKDG